jgi:predicted lipoprotein with Yx(FWY)xxD motif
MTERMDMDPGSRRHPRPRAWIGAAIGMAALAGSLAAVPAVGAQAATSSTKTAKKVVEVVSRVPEGKTAAITMLATTGGASLYIAPATGCTGSCLTVWPPLQIGAGKTPTGIKGLGTTRVMISGKSRRQVTYLGKALYTFEDDSGTSLNGNGVGGFKAAKVH